MGVLCRTRVQEECSRHKAEGSRRRISKRGSSPTVREGALQTIRGFYEEKANQRVDCECWVKESRHRSAVLRQTSTCRRRRRARSLQLSFEGARTNPASDTFANASSVANALAHHQRHDAQRRKGYWDRVDRQAGRHGLARRQSLAG